MFTGIIEEMGRIARTRVTGGGRHISVYAKIAPELRVDQSVSLNGVCQTVVAVSGDTFDVVAVEETLRKTTLGALRQNVPVNLERAMLPTGRLDGHIVQGHVDATGHVLSVEPQQTGRLYRIAFDPAFAAYVVPAGSIAIDGISLTVARLADHEITVAIIPHTYTHTIVASSWKSGAAVNLEFDLIGKYVVRYLSRTGPESLSEGWLRERGF
jgi:riboflavin synthase